jgi:hypothetical protein
MSRAYLLVLGEREAIRWVLREQRMAFPSTRRAEVSALEVGDELFLYTTRGAWHNPTRDRGRVIGHATVASAVRAFDQPLEISGRQFHSGCRLRIDSVAPYPSGVVLASLVDRLAVFPKPHAWSAYLRRALLQLPEVDVALLAQELKPHTVEPGHAAATYASRPLAARH